MAKTNPSFKELKSMTPEELRSYASELGIELARKIVIGTIAAVTIALLSAAILAKIAVENEEA